jgi:hypothetical protein
LLAELTLTISKRASALMWRYACAIRAPGARDPDKEQEFACLETARGVCG